MPSPFLYFHGRPSAFLGFLVSSKFRSSYAPAAAAGTVTRKSIARALTHKSLWDRLYGIPLSGISLIPPPTRGRGGGRGRHHPVVNKKHIKHGRWTPARPDDRVVRTDPYQGNWIPKSAMRRTESGLGQGNKSLSVP